MSNTNLSISDISELRAALSRLSVCGSVSSVAELALLDELLLSILRNDAFAVQANYHEFTRAMLGCSVRRVSGNLFKDYLLYRLFECENAFSALAARSYADDALFAAMAHDIRQLSALSNLNTQDIVHLLDTASVVKDSSRNDLYTKMSDAAWAGSASDNPYRKPKSGRCEQTCDFSISFLPWDYGTFELRDTYISDSALEQLYYRFLRGSFSDFVEDLWSFHEEYGTGAFLKHRAFTCDSSGELTPLSSELFAPIAPPYLFSDERESLIAVAIRFMQNEPVCGIKVCGPRGIGKTTLCLSLLDELPELRMVVMHGSAVTRGAISAIISTLRKQPLRFILLIDGCTDAALDMVDSCVLSGVDRPSNVMFCAVGEEFLPRHTFITEIKLDSPELSAFAHYVHSYLSSLGVSIEFSTVNNACMDYRLETHLPFSYSAANTIAAQLLQQ